MITPYFSPHTPISEMCYVKVYHSTGKVIPEILGDGS